MDSRMETVIAGVTWKNPVTTASGTFGSGREYGELIDLNRLGAITVKGVSEEAWKGNPVPRLAETQSGLLNSIGLQNAGAEYFINHDIPFLRQYDTKIIVNICGHTLSQYCAVAEKFADCDIDMLELNISCPNVEEGGLSFGTDPHVVERVVKAVRHYAKQPLIVKLSPEVTDIMEVARAAVSGGADALSLINTLRGMKIDIHKRRPILASKIGGYSGPGVMPVALRMVYEVCHSVDVPVIGMGGISTFEDALQFIMAGAQAVAVGTANFHNPYASVEIIDGIRQYMKENRIPSLEEIRGCID
ncbi:dihydroorotate dehydrogenase [Frisingicoccus caecimuris]|uniref:Dihydroorotate dehydrogenase n=1 Tax=Frisingicoccus caecimuris TaxID=1796636 RepID=A0A4R2LB08_9FIRM|nr:dihydroorotate dehydrogenase [Frisingicoccus caecimuris]MCR1919392.1 dihydroorotate dehydrogenase [Frisingicoccus caecimuris]TCO84118.1 dihydroorotate oxidase B catalytic subunit [Frisingicoccus caecimuris]